MADAVEATIKLPPIILTKAIDPDRYRDLLKRTAYYRCTQHRSKPFTFDGCLAEFGEDLDVTSDDFIPMRRRRPHLRMDLAKVIVTRLTPFVFGKDKFPQLKIEGDEDAEDYVRALCVEAGVPVKMVEARNLGGACGSVAFSWGFVEGRPIVEVHEAAFVEVVEWTDYHDRRPSAVLKCYPYKLREFTSDGLPIDVEYWYARYWDQQIDVTWPKIRLELANSVDWPSAPHTTVAHSTNICPVYWVQNMPDSSHVDGMSDYDEQEECFDTGDILLSASAQGTILNVDPTVVIKDDPNRNDGVLRKGSQFAIYSKGGAEYLEISGAAQSAAVSLIDKLKQIELDKASVVVPDPSKLSALGLSGEAIKALYAPMLAKCDVLREQYGKALREMLEDMLAVAHKLTEEPRMGDDGQKYWARVVLPPRVTKEKTDSGETVVTRTERVPGVGTNVTLSWPPYFPITAQDKKDAVQTMKEGTGGQQVISQETAVTELAPIVGVEDPRAELDKIEAEKEANAKRAKDIMGAGAPRLPFNGDNEGDPDGEGKNPEGDDT